MKKRPVRISLRGFGVAACMSWACLIGLPAAANDSAASVESGRELFVREWSAGDARSPNGDGLGPMFNETSCAACHNQGGVGGAGGAAKNVKQLKLVHLDMLALKNNVRDFERSMHSVHPQLSQNSTVVVHRHSTLAGYDSWRDSLLSGGKAVPKDQRDGLLFNISSRAPQVPKLRQAANQFTRNHLKFQVSERNTPALFGLGLIDQISKADLDYLVTSQALVGHVSGRRTILSNGFGLFGWRLESPSLEDFVLTACASELGLEVPGHHQAVSPSAPQETSEHGLDMDEAMCRDLVAFVRSLPAPEILKPTDAHQSQIMHQGEQLLKQVGCTECHVRDVGPAKDVFSDFLLHDMSPTSVQDSPVTFAFGAGYYGMPTVVGTKTFDPCESESHASPMGVGARELAQRVTPFGQVAICEPSPGEWRTPPLWGLRDSAPYMHDGRAETIAEAIAMHSGEGEDSAKAFFKLTGDEQSAVLTFLKSLVAPQSTEATLVAQQ